jgi:homoserine kinase
MTSVTLSVPASAANLGPGFDSLGLALSLRNTLEVWAAPSGIRVLIEGEGKDSLPSDASNLIVRAMLKVFRLADRPAPGLELRAHNRIPLAAGLGSSAAAIVGLAAVTLDAWVCPAPGCCSWPARWKVTPTMPPRPSSVA